jgi:hypothetical protein
MRHSSSAIEKLPSGSPTVTGAADFAGFALSSSQSMQPILIDPPAHRKPGSGGSGSSHDPERRRA